jgi:4-hydroxybenzoate polyprenyltransferase
MSTTKGENQMPILLFVFLGVIAGRLVPHAVNAVIDAEIERRKREEPAPAAK